MANIDEEVHGDYELEQQFVKMQAKAQLQMLSELESQVHRKQSEVLQLNEDVDLKTQMLIGFSKHRNNYNTTRNKA